MQYVLLIYQGTTPVPTGPDAWATLSHEEQKATYRDYAALNKTPGVTPGLTLGLPKERFIRAKPQPPALPTAVWTMHQRRRRQRFRNFRPEVSHRTWWPGR